MNYYLIISFVISIIAIIYIWYITRNISFISDNELLPLNTTSNSLLSNWYKKYAKPSFTFFIDEYLTASTLLKRLYNLEIDPNIILIGENLSSQYYNITRQHLLPFSSDTSYSPHLNYLFDIRSSIGLNYDIAIIHNPRILSLLRRTNTIDLSETISILDNELEVIAKNYLSQILKYRWDKINSIPDTNILNTTGSFLYLRHCNIANIETISTPFGFRINLLCSDLEFETFINRWKKSLPSFVLPSVLPEPSY